MKYHDPKGNVITSKDPNLLIRETNLIERLCQHGVGHPMGHLKKWDPSWMGVHGCDGCCSQAQFHLDKMEHEQ